MAKKPHLPHPFANFQLLLKTQKRLEMQARAPFFRSDAKDTIKIRVGGRGHTWRSRLDLFRNGAVLPDCPRSLQAAGPKARASADEPAAAQAKPAQPCAKTPRGSLMRDIQ